MALTDAKVRALKGRNAPYKVADGEGLYILVTCGGSRLWNLAYRFNGKQKTLALGKYPAVSLLDARRARDAAKQILLSSNDPSAERKAERRKQSIAAANTFDAVANEWFTANQERWVQTYSSRLRSRLDDDLLPALGRRPIAEIQPLEVLDAIRAIEKRDAVEMAKRVMQMASAVFRYAVATARCSRDPTADLKGALKSPRPPKRRRALPAAEVPTFMAALEDYDGGAVTRLGLKLMVLTFVRTSELRFAQWSEFESVDGDAPLWRIPASRMKMRSLQSFSGLDRLLLAQSRRQALSAFGYKYTIAGAARPPEASNTAPGLNERPDVNGAIQLCAKIMANRATLETRNRGERVGTCRNASFLCPAPLTLLFGNLEDGTVAGRAAPVCRAVEIA